MDAVTPYTLLGREEGVRRLVARFYELMSTLPEAATIRAMHAADLEPMIDKLATYLVGWGGGPRMYTERFGSVIIPSVHRPFAIGEAERDAWLLCFETALRERELGDEWTERILVPIRQMADKCRTDRA